MISPIYLPVRVVPLVSVRSVFFRVRSDFMSVWDYYGGSENPSSSSKAEVVLISIVTTIILAVRGNSVNLFEEAIEHSVRFQIERHETTRIPEAV